MAITFAAGALVDRANDTKFDGAIGSVGVFFRRNSRPVGTQMSIFSRHAAITSGGGFNLFLETTVGANQDKFGVQIKNTGGTQTNLVYCASQVVFDGGWHLASINFNTANAAALDLYIDGGNKASGNNTAAWSFLANSTRLARSLDAFWQSFDGSLAHAFWYTQTLTDAEHRALACGVSPYAIRPWALLMYLPLAGPLQIYDAGPNRFTTTNSGTITLATVSPISEPLNEGWHYGEYDDSTPGSGRRKFFTPMRSGRY